MSGPGSSGNVIAALCSLFIPGLGQLLQGRPFAALFQFLLGAFLWAITFAHFGWPANILSALSAALYRPRK